MHILVTGGGGFIGQKLARRLVQDGSLRGNPVASVTLVDLAAPAPVAGPIPVHSLACDISDPAALGAVMTRPYDVIFHLAAVVSGAAEADFDLGLRVNLLGTLNLFQAARAAGNAPVLVYASSAAVHGGEEPQVITDGVELNPQTSYGTQKAIGELLLTDMSRRGFLDGRGLRLPTVTIRPGKPNAAASSFISSIFREPLQGGTANCPVPPEFEVWHTAPRTVVANLIHAANLDGAALGFNRCLNLPGRTDTIGGMIAAMRRVAGPVPETRITWQPDPVIERIVRGWRARMLPEKAIRLGFTADSSFDDTIRWFSEDDSLPAAR
jgi:nucleoside-diphosphate-sugar epimerase